MLTGDFRGRNVLLLSPHSDDIAYSLCGRLLAGRTPPEACALVTVFSISQFAPFADPPLDDIAAITTLRGEEDQAFARAMGFVRAEMGLSEAPIRDGLTNLDDLFTIDHLAHPYLATLTREMAAVLTAADWSEVYLPLGIGGHVDHGLLNEAVRRAGADRTRLRYYEDLPYAGEMEQSEYEREIARLADGLRPELTPAGAWVERKLALLGLYPSQVQHSDLQSVLALTARIGGERLWQFPAR